MPQNSTPPSLKDPELYEELRKDGASKQKARISNAAARTAGRPSGDGVASPARTRTGRWPSCALARRNSASAGTPVRARRSSSTCFETPDVPRLRRVRPGRDLGYRRLRSGSGFRYVDADGAALAERERVVALVIPRRGTTWICAAANGHIQATGVDEAGRMQYLYHPDWSTTRDKGKYARALQLAESLPRARGRITASLRRDDLDRERVLATAFRLLDQAAPRVGSERYFTAHGSRGLTTLQRRDAAVSGTVTSLRFPGKSGKRQSLDVDDEDLAVVVELLAAGRPAAPLLAYARGRAALRSPRDVNVYVRTMTGGSFTAKDFRTLRGTILAADALARIGTTATKPIASAPRCWPSRRRPRLWATRRRWPRARTSIPACSRGIDAASCWTRPFRRNRRSVRCWVREATLVCGRDSSPLVLAGRPRAGDPRRHDRRRDPRGRGGAPGGGEPASAGRAGRHARHQPRGFAAAGRHRAGSPIGIRALDSSSGRESWAGSRRTARSPCRPSRPRARRPTSASSSSVSLFGGVFAAVVGLAAGRRIADRPGEIERRRMPSEPVRDGSARRRRGLGAGARYVMDAAIMRGRSGAFPLGILLVNVLGSFLLGLVTGLGPNVSPAWASILGVGVLGGFTTFSTVSTETALLAERGRRDWAWVNLIGTLVLALIAAAAGLVIGELFPR
jgi:protein CrcB